MKHWKTDCRSSTVTVANFHIKTWWGGGLVIEQNNRIQFRPVPVY